MSCTREVNDDLCDLSVRIPSGTMKDMRRRAADLEVTIRRLVLMALRDAGVSVPEECLVDRRKRRRPRGAERRSLFDQNAPAGVGGSAAEQLEAFIREAATIGPETEARLGLVLHRAQMSLGNVAAEWLVQRSPVLGDVPIHRARADWQGAGDVISALDRLRQGSS